MIARKSERGLTLVEVMITMVIMLMVMGGAMSFLIFQTRFATLSYDRSDIQRGGRAAISIMEEKVGAAGLGLPRLLAIKSFSATGDCNLPKLEVAALDHVRQWTVASTTGSTASGTVTLAAADPVPDKPAGGGSNDVDIAVARWVYLFQTAGANGFGMARLAAKRDKTATTVSIDSTAFGSTNLDLGSGSPLNSGASGRPTAMLVGDVSGFGVDCSDVNRPYIYWETNGIKTPIASNLDTRQLTVPNAAIGALAEEVVGLRFRFQLDTDGDGVVDSTVSTLTFNTDPAVATNDDVRAVEVLVRLRSDRPDAKTNLYRIEDFLRVIRTPNINTRSAQYIFVDNSGI